MRALLLGLVVCGGAVLAAGEQGPYKRTQDFDWKIAQRFDDGRVVIMLSSDDARITGDERATVLGTQFEKPAPAFLAKFLDGLTRADADWGRRVTGSTAKAGDRWAIDAGRAGWFETSVDGYVLDGGGCQDIAAMMATVAANADSFGRVKEKYFPARAMSGWTLPPGVTRVGPMTYAVTDGQRQDIERLLQQRFRTEADRLLTQLGTDRHLPDREPWRQIYARVAAGAARLRFDVQALRLTPDGFPRLYVRAVWNLDGQTVFLMGAWMRVTPALDFDAVDVHASRFIWGGLFEGQMDPSLNGEILNVVDIDRDGLAEVVMLYRYYESFSMEASRYPFGEPDGAQVIAKYGSGC